MTDFDQIVRNALRGVAGADQLAREPGVAEELLGTFRSRHRWIHGIAFAFTFVCFVAAVWSAVRFTGATTTHEQLQWGGLCVLGMLCVGMLKMYFWLEIHTNRMLRELKRVELLLLLRPRDRDDEGG